MSNDHPSRSPKKLPETGTVGTHVFWLKDKSLADLDNFPEPDELAEEIIENLEAGLESVCGAQSRKAYAAYPAERSELFDQMV